MGKTPEELRQEIRKYVDEIDRLKLCKAKVRDRLQNTLSEYWQVKLKLTPNKTILVDEKGVEFLFKRFKNLTHPTHGKPTILASRKKKDGSWSVVVKHIYYLEGWTIKNDDETLATSTV